MRSIRCVAVLAALVVSCVAAAQASASFSLHVLSDRADLISGGEALVSVSLPRKLSPASVKVTLGSSDVTSEFAQRANGSYEGLVTGLSPGANTLTAEAPGGLSSQITIGDHPIGGPVIAGPQVQPWRCQNSDATDAQCDAPTVFTYEYKSVVTGAMETYEPSNPPSPSLIASTTTEGGQTVPFIVRTETGYQDRDQYKIAVLYQPGLPWQPRAPQPQWAH